MCVCVCVTSETTTTEAKIKINVKKNIYSNFRQIFIDIYIYHQKQVIELEQNFVPTLCVFPMILEIRLVNFTFTYIVVDIHAHGTLFYKKKSENQFYLFSVTIYHR